MQIWSFTELFESVCDQSRLFSYDLFVNSTDFIDTLTSTENVEFFQTIVISLYFFHVPFFTVSFFYLLFVCLTNGTTLLYAKENPPFLLSTRVYLLSKGNDFITITTVQNMYSTYMHTVLINRKNFDNWLTLVFSLLFVVLDTHRATDDRLNRTRGWNELLPFFVVNVNGENNYVFDGVGERMATAKGDRVSSREIDDCELRKWKLSQRERSRSSCYQ